MLAIVVTLGGYFAGLQWLISPPDPWQANARMQTSSAHPAVKKKTPAKLVEAAAVEPAAPKEPEIQVTTAAMPPAVEIMASEPAPPVEPAKALRPLPQPAAPARAEERLSTRAEATRPEPRRETKARPVHRKLAERSSGRKLQLMVLRTYERSDGTRFSRLLPLREARSVIALQPEW
jgi:hypothetical protein